MKLSQAEQAQSAEAARAAMEVWLAAAIVTPSIVIHGAQVERNLAQMASYCREHGLKLRPHTKTHKSLRLAARQLALGACGLTVAKPAEAEVMAHVGSDLLLAYPIVAAEPAARMARLASWRQVRIAVDSVFAVEQLAGAAHGLPDAAIGILVEIDVGFRRTGVQSPEEAVAIARAVERQSALRLDGLCCFPGQIIGPPQEQLPALRAYAECLENVLAAWRAQGFEARIVSGGSTPTAYQSHQVKPLTEIRPGTYIFNDMNTVLGGHCSLDACAARIAATVVSHAVPGQVVLDAGSKVLTSDRCGPAPDQGFGYIVEYPEARITRLSEEHAHVDVRECALAPPLGSRVTVVPNHICPCINLQDRVYYQEPDGTLLRLTIDGRGKVW